MALALRLRATLVALVVVVNVASFGDDFFFQFQLNVNTVAAINTGQKLVADMTERMQILHAHHK